MNAEKLLAVDSRVVGSIRIVGLVASLLSATFCILIHQRIVVPPATFYMGACLPLAAGAALFGVGLVVWRRRSLTKLLVYSIGLPLLLILVSTLVIGFTSFTFLVWMLLISALGVYLHTSGVIIGLGSMLASLVTWVLIHPELQRFAELFGLVASSLAVIAMVSVLLSVWRVANSYLANIDASSERAQYERGRLTSLINSMADGVMALDSDGTVVLYNAAALDILDSNTSMQGQPVQNYLKLITATNATIDTLNFIQNTRTASINRDLRVKYADGSFANLSVAVTPVRLGYGHDGAPGFVILLRDITREKSLEEERDEFISVVSHELRTPIAISEGNVSNAQIIVEKSGDIVAVKSALEAAHDQILFLSDMINDLATLSRAERGKLTLEVESVDVKQLMSELANNYTPDARKKGLKLECDSDEGLGELHSSKLYVREVLQNFITNAIKYTEEGSVSVAAHAHDNGVMFSVSDTGIGISKADQERVFDKFFRSEDYRTRQNNGTGLGLYVTMKLARLIHADINVSSELNKGSTFTIFIPNLKER